MYVIIVLAAKVRANHDHTEREMIKKSVKAAFMLIPLLGLPNIAQTVSVLHRNSLSVTDPVRAQPAQHRRVRGVHLLQHADVRQSGLLRRHTLLLHKPRSHPGDEVGLVTLATAAHQRRRSAPRFAHIECRC